jgi:hypothetical protein
MPVGHPGRCAGRGEEVTPIQGTPLIRRPSSWLGVVVAVMVVVGVGHVMDDHV